jgi:hypothetical protein
MNTQAAQWRRLGYLSLNCNERSKFQARELKSVYIDATGTFLRLMVHKCYINELNLFNQVLLPTATIAATTLLYTYVMQSHLS